jgi:hypothetical protein
VTSISDTSSRSTTVGARAEASPASSSDPAPDARAVDGLVRRLALEHPGLAESEIRQLINWCLDVTADASVQRFRLVLAERAVRRYIHRRSGREDAGGPMATDGQQRVESNSRRSR